MKRRVAFAVAVISVLVVALVAAFFVVRSVISKSDRFLVGVTFCGNSTREAKLLIDRVKDYTNLFVLQSGPLMKNETAVIETGDYAISCGLRFAAYFESQFASGNLIPLKEARWLGIAEERWSNMFAGVYFGDEAGGKMLETYVYFFGSGNNGTDGDTSITKRAEGGVSIGDAGSGFGSAQYFPDGKIIVQKSSGFMSFGDIVGNLTTYYPNGTITLWEFGGDFFTMENGTDRISQLEPYEEVLSRHPIPNCDAAAEIFANRNQKLIDGLISQWQLSNRSFPIFTADYALHWWDYQSGYDMVLAELGWNNTVAQEIGLVRGAANFQNKAWGTIITWTYTHPPYLTNGGEIYNQMRMSYESGAEYVLIFNYAENMSSPYGIMQDEHFDALERFWKDVVQNPFVAHGGVKAEAAFVFPKDYGWGLRNPDDIVWGLWEPTTEAKQSWTSLQDALEKHGLRLDIVYDDAAYPFAGKYSQVYYWNQTS